MDQRLLILAGTFLLVVISLIVLAVSVRRARRDTEEDPYGPAPDWPKLEAMTRPEGSEDVFAERSGGLADVLNAPLRTGRWRPETSAGETTDWDQSPVEPKPAAASAPTPTPTAEPAPAPKPAAASAPTPMPTAEPAPAPKPAADVAPDLGEATPERPVAASPRATEEPAQPEEAAPRELRPLAPTALDSSLPPVSSVLLGPAPGRMVEPGSREETERGQEWIDSLVQRLEEETDTTTGGSDAPAAETAPRQTPPAVETPPQQAPPAVETPPQQTPPAEEPQTPVPLSAMSHLPSPPVEQPQPSTTSPELTPPSLQLESERSTQSPPPAEPEMPRPAAAIHIGSPVPPAAPAPRPAVSAPLPRKEPPPKATPNTPAPEKDANEIVPRVAETAQGTPEAPPPLEVASELAKQAEVSGEVPEPAEIGRDAPEYELVSPVEMWFGEARVGVKSGTRTHDLFQKYARVLFDDLKKATQDNVRG